MDWQRIREAGPKRPDVHEILSDAGEPNLEKLVSGTPDEIEFERIKQRGAPVRYWEGRET